MGVADASTPVLVVKQGGAGEREIALPPREFLEGPAPVPWPWRQMQLGYDLVRSARRRHWAGEEFAGAQRLSSGRPDEGDLRITGHRDPGQFRGRISMGKAAADGALVAD